MSRLDALELATEIARVDMEGVATKRRRMAIPQPGTNFNPATADIESMWRRRSALGGISVRGEWPAHDHLRQTCAQA